MSGYSNQILDGDGTLIRDQMQSSNFQTGVGGWQLLADGDAEFNQVTVRGTLIEGVAGGLRVEIGPGSTLKFFNAAGVLVGTLQPNSYDLTGVAGQNWNVKLSSGNVVQLMQPAPGGALTYGPAQISSIGGGGAPALILDSPTVLGHPPAELQLLGENLPALARIAASVIVALVGGAGGTPETWHGVAAGVGFAANWADFAGPVQPARYRLMPDGTVSCSGGVKSTVNVSSPTTIFTFPAGYRPAAQEIFPNNQGGYLSVDPSGTLALQAFAGPVTVGLLGLSHIRFPLASLA